MKKLLFYSLLFVAFSITAAGQIPQPSATPPVADDDNVLKISTTLVQLDVVVTDKKGDPVTDLKPEDFEIFENGKRREITNLSFVTVDSKNAPNEAIKSPITTKNSIPIPPVKLRAEQVRRTYAIVIDDLGLSFSSVYWVQQSLKKFVNGQMREGDLVAIIRTGGGIGALQSFTSDKRQLMAAVDKIKWNAQGRSGVSSFEPLTTSLKEDLEGRQKIGGGSAPKQPVGTQDDYLFERQIGNLRNENFAKGTLGALRYIIGGMRDLPGRKAMMFFSEGFQLTEPLNPSGLNSELRTTTEAGQLLRRIADWANRSSVVIYTLDPRGLDEPGMLFADDAVAPSSSVSASRQQDRISNFTESQQSLRYLAYETGGLPFVNQNDLSLGMRHALDDQVSYYLLGYQPDEETFDPKKNKYNKLEVKLKRPDLKVRHRSGFFGVTDEKIRNAAQTPREKLASALTSPFGAGDVSLSLYPIYQNDAANGNLIQALVYIDAKDLKFTEEKGNHKANFDIIAMTFGDNGGAASQLFKNYTIEVGDRLYQNMLVNGFVYKIAVPIKKSGAYQFRVALRDTSSNKIGAASQYIEVPNFDKKVSLSQLILDNYTPEELQKIRLGGGNDSERSPLLDTTVRKFKRGTILRYDYEIYNPKQSKSLVTQTRLIRDGKLVYEETPALFKFDGQKDLMRLQSYGALTLGKDLEAGDYILQTVVTDETAKEKDATAAQFVQFEIFE